MNVADLERRRDRVNRAYRKLVSRNYAAGDFVLRDWLSQAQADLTVGYPTPRTEAVEQLAARILEEET